MTKIIITTYDENTDRKKRLMEFVSNLHPDARAKVYRLHGDQRCLFVDWVGRPSINALAEVKHKWHDDYGDCPTNHYVLGTFLLGEFESVSFPPDIEAPTVLTTYSERPEEKIGFFDEYVSRHIDLGSATKSTAKAPSISPT
jgi:hypothetical protein